MSKKNGKTIEEQYKKRELHESILKDPGMYIGPTGVDNIDMYYFNDKTDSIKKDEKEIVLGLYKIIDEIVVNAADNTVRNSKKCNIIKINVNKETGIISVYNNGCEIPVEIHKEYNIYVPELLFGNLLTSANYDQEDRLVGGRHGIGSKAANIYSKEFSIEIVDSKRKKKYFQQFSNNMYDKEEPVITDLENKQEGYIKTKFLPDYKKFGQKKLTNDTYQIIKRRAYDIAATTNKKVKVYFNDEEIEANNFRNYIDLFYKDENKKVIYRDVNERWSVGVIYDPDSHFNHMTFVNNINTFGGGTHLNHVVEQIIKKVTKKITDKDKKNNIKVKPSQIKDNITVFVNCLIEGPDFPSQTKETMSKNANKFKVKCNIDDKFIDELCKNTSIVNDVFEISKVRHENQLSKTDGKKRLSVKDIPKLKDASFAGTGKSSDCILIVTEGDSAFNFAEAGREVIGTEYYGAVPLKGKMLNPKKSATQKALDNTEFKMLKKALGLQHGAVYENTKSLRYGSVLLLTDQDVDGYHIKGLFMNFIHTYWPSLLKIEGFVKSIATPIIKVYKSKNITGLKPLKIFFTESEFKKWANTFENNKVPDSYYIKYFKGLGTSTTEEARESFDDFKNRLIDYTWENDKINIIELDNKSNNSNNDDEDDNVSLSIVKGKKTKQIVDYDKLEKSDLIIMTAFADKFEDKRKGLVKKYDPSIIIENNQKSVTYNEFVTKELVHFFHNDVMRSVPNVCDGFKPSQRKVLYGTFLRKLHNSETKVSQLSGYISDNTGYHHGEASLQGCIIDMAQDFVGSNNINLLYPSGAFGTRRMGGKDHASPRYIMTKNGELLRHIYPVEDEPILEHIDDENAIVEPYVYHPIIPIILVNGCSGIGTGYSSSIPGFNVKDLIHNIRIYLSKHKKLSNEQIIDKLREMIPWYKGFNGTIQKIDSKTYKTYGCFEIIDQNKIRVTELPIGKWTEDYIAFLTGLLEKNSMITDYDIGASTYKVDITISFKTNVLQSLLKNDELLDEMKLKSTLKTSNMHLCKIIEEDGIKNIVIKKYDDVNNILIDYIEMRYQAYVKRKKYYIKVLENDLSVLKYRKKFIEYIIDKKIILERRKKDDVIRSLEEHKFPRLGVNINSPKSYDYLTGLPLFSLTDDKIEELENNILKKSEELDTYRNTSIEQLWEIDLTKFEKAYDKYYDDYIKKINTDCKNKKGKSKDKSIKSKGKPKSKSKSSSK